MCSILHPHPCPAPRHATFLLQYLHAHLSEADLQQVTDLLQRAASEREEGRGDSKLAYVNVPTKGKPFQLNKIPTVR